MTLFLTIASFYDLKLDCNISRLLFPCYTGWHTTAVFVKLYWITLNHLIYYTCVYSTERKSRLSLEAHIHSRIYFPPQLFLIPRKMLKITLLTPTKSLHTRAHRIHVPLIQASINRKRTRFELNAELSSLRTCTAYCAAKAAEKIAENPEPVHAVESRWRIRPSIFQR